MLKAELVLLLLWTSIANASGVAKGSDLSVGEPDFLSSNYQLSLAEVRQLASEQEPKNLVKLENIRRRGTDGLPTDELVRVADRLEDRRRLRNEYDILKGLYVGNGKVSPAFVPDFTYYIMKHVGAGMSILARPWMHDVTSLRKQAVGLDLRQTARLCAGIVDGLTQMHGAGVTGPGLSIGSLLLRNDAQTVVFTHFLDAARHHFRGSRLETAIREDIRTLATTFLELLAARNKGTTSEEDLLLTSGDDSKGRLHQHEKMTEEQGAAFHPLYSDMKSADTEIDLATVKSRMLGIFDPVAFGSRSIL